MTAGAYEILLHVLGSGLIVGGFFVAGLGLGWVFWRGILRRIPSKQRSDSGRS